MGEDKSHVAASQAWRQQYSPHHICVMTRIKKAIYWLALAMLNHSGGVQLLLHPRNSGFHLSVTFKTLSPLSASITITTSDPCLTHAHTRAGAGVEGLVKKAGRRTEAQRE